MKTPTQVVDSHFGMSLRRVAAIALLLAACFAFSTCALAQTADDVTLVEGGRAKAVLVLDDEAFQDQPEARPRGRRQAAPSPAADERLAAEEIQKHIELATGATVAIVARGADLDGRVPIRIGAAADEGLDAEIRKQGSDPSSFALNVDDRGISIRGLSSAGTLCGAYELLEQIGVRWFMPGELGLVVPHTETIRLKPQRTIHVPSFPARHLQGVSTPEWERRMRLGGPYFPGSHGVPGFKLRESQKLFEGHPEWFALVDGRRTLRQLCISNPEVLCRAVEVTKQYFRSHPEAEIMGIGANDGRGFCECAACRALDGGDYDPFGHNPSMTDRYVWFFNRVLEGIEDEFPDKRLGFYAYSVYNRPPVKEKPDRRLVPAVALITLCRLHGMQNPVCPEKSYEESVIRQWGQLVPEVYYRGYWFNLADPGLPFYMIERIRREVPLGKKLGVAGWRVESPYNWAASTPSRYIASKLMWNSVADVEALMDDFYEKFYGPAARPMRRYVETMSDALTGADYHTGSAWDMPHVYPPSIRAEARQALDEAARLAPEGLFAKRVWMATRSLDYLDAFDAMLESRSVHDYARSMQALERMETIRDELLANDPPLIGKASKSYLERFFSKATREGYQRTTGGNRLVAGFVDQWLFQIDPEQVGEAIGWWKPDNTGGNWQTLRTSTESWSDQGLRYYKGLAWYRQKVDVPAEFHGKRVFLWVGGIDELAKVWLNGKCLGISPRASFTPFEMDASEAVAPGGPNTLAICVSNMTLNEVGTGGITGPVMLYAPAAGAAAEPQNSRPPSTVFPEY